jgi:hypothetical protein
LKASRVFLSPTYAFTEKELLLAVTKDMELTSKRRE